MMILAEIPEPTSWFQVAALAVSAFAALIGWLIRRDQHVRNGQKNARGKPAKEPGAQAIYSKLEEVASDVKDVKATGERTEQRLDDHIESHRERTRPRS